MEAVLSSLTNENFEVETKVAVELAKKKKMYKSMYLSLAGVLFITVGCYVRK